MCMSDKAKATRNAYLRAWRKKNPDKAKKHQVDYWERKAQKLTETSL